MDEQEKKEQAKSQSASASTGSGAQQSGDPGRTPGSAEGDEQTVDESLRQKEGKQ